MKAQVIQGRNKQHIYKVEKFLMKKLQKNIINNYNKNNNKMQIITLPKKKKS